MNDRVVVFSKEEFMILAAASGIRQMYGFSVGEKVDDEEAVQTMYQLAGRGVLLSLDGRFQIQEPVCSWFLQIKNAKTTLDVHKRSGKKCIIYIGEFAVKVSLSRRGNGMLEVQAMLQGDVWKHLTEEGWIPEGKEKQHDLGGY